MEKPGTKLKRYCLTTRAGDLTSYASLTEAFAAGKRTDGFMVFDSKAQTGEIESWILEEFRKIGLDTAKSVLNKDREELLRLTDLEEETIDAVLNILRKEFESTE